MRTIVVTGYKPIEMGIFKSNDPKIEFVKAALRKRIVNLVDDGLEWVLVSGQMGVELWAAQVVLDMKDEGYEINLGVIPPFENQDERWPEDLQLAYEEVTMTADFFQPIYNKKYEGPHQFKAKDQFLIEHSDGTLILFDEETDGSPKFYLNKVKKHQEQHDYQVLYITPMDLDDIVEELRMADPDYWSS
ncbi:DUF1273 domain-containing protein [Halobacillus litoralis]|uniref:SLOG family protein n=1 Tax=Halobacillus litoralis TaxID=45668 RepID=UPI001CD4F145|nr:DUF1273 domain-containing protein [Halobacillus litoralis]MCA0970389.1 DUF1273 domain-containing protein [Halobacillus litoralis]